MLLLFALCQVDAIGPIMGKIELLYLHTDVNITFYVFYGFSYCSVNFIIKMKFSHCITCRE